MALSLYVYRCPDCPASVQLSDTGAPYCLGPGHKALMVRVPDTEKMLLSLDAPRSQPAHLIPAKVEALHAAGILLPETQASLDWMWHRRKENGLAEAFLLIGGRRYIDLAAFTRLVRERRA